MEVRYSNQKKQKKHSGSLTSYQEEVRAVVDSGNMSVPESSVATWQDNLMRQGIDEVLQRLGTVTDVVLVGIGGSSLGTEAIHSALYNKEKAKLHVLDTVADHAISKVLDAIQGVELHRLAICIISKSGGTTETLANAAVVLDELKKTNGAAVYSRVVCVGNPGNALLQFGEKMGALVLPMHEFIGGRYSVFTAVGLLPLALLGYDYKALLDGQKDAMSEPNEEAACKGAFELMAQIKDGIRIVNFFAFDTRLEKLGQWYRQLTAESLGKEHTKSGSVAEIAFVPTISTVVELHSIGQLYFSGFPGIYTDFVSIVNKQNAHAVPDDSLLPILYVQIPIRSIASAIEGGVQKAYDERKLPYRLTQFSELSERELGTFMGVRMLETMYLAHLMDVNAFDQPNVELYKEKTREILEG